MVYKWDCLLYVLTETNVGEWIVNLVIHPKLMYRNAFFINYSKPSQTRSKCRFIMRQLQPRQLQPIDIS